MHEPNYEETMTTEQLVRRLCDAWVRKNNDDIADLFAADGVFVDPLHGRPLVGPDDIRTTNQPAVDELSDVQVDLYWVMSDQNRACAEGRMKATVTADGSQMDFQFAIVAESANEKLTRVTEYFDTRPLTS